MSLGGVHGYEDNLGLGDHQPEFRREEQALPASTSFNEPIEAGLVERYAALPKLGNEIGIFIDARHSVAEVSEARPRHQPNVAGPDDPYLEVLDRITSLSVVLDLRTSRWTRKWLYGYSFDQPYYARVSKNL